MEGVNSGILGGIIAVILMGALTPLMKKLFYKWNSRKHIGYNRVLTSNEKSWLLSNTKMLAQEKAELQYPIWIYFLWSGTLPVIIGMGSIFGIFFFTYKLLVTPVSPQTLAWERVDFGVSFVLTVFLGIFMAAIAMIYLAKHFPIIRDYLTYKYGWGYMQPKPRGELEISEELEHQLRLKKVSIEDTYDSDYFSSLIFHRTSAAWKKWTLAILCVTLLFFAFDLRYSVDVYEGNITKSPYFSFLTTEYNLSEVKMISRECTLGKSNGRLYPYLDYKLVMSDDSQIDLFSLNGNGDTPHLDTIEKILPALKDVQVLPTTVNSAPVVKLQPTLANCFKFIRQTRNKNDAIRTISLFDVVSN